MCITISLLNMKGGVGKTTLAVNLAWYMHENAQKNVLLVDLDPQFNATQYVMDYSEFDKHRRNNGTIADLLVDQPHLSLRPSKVKKNLTSAIHTITSGGGRRLDLLPSDLNLAWAVKNPAQMDFKLEKLLSGMRKAYDYVFVDCAPTDSVLTTMALMASNYLLVPMRPDRFSVLGSENLLKTIDLFRKNCQDPHGVQDLGVVFTQVTGKSKIETECMNEVRADAQRQGRYVFESALRYSQSFVRSVKDQTPIFRTIHAHATSKDAAADIAIEMQARIAELR